MWAAFCGSGDPYSDPHSVSGSGSFRLLCVILLTSQGMWCYTGELKNPDQFRYGEETLQAWREGNLSEDIMAEQQKVSDAELIIFQVRGHI